MSAQHTPGPWTNLDGGQEDVAVFAGDDRKLVVDCTAGDDLMAYDVALANARLIAAAPELLAALRDLVRADCTAVILQAMTPQQRQRLETAKRVILKAEGRT